MPDGPNGSHVSSKLSPPAWPDRRVSDQRPDRDPAPPVSQSVLDEAKDIVSGARRATYGRPLVNHRAIARLWQAFLDNKAELAPGPLTPQEVAELMVLLKLARLQQTPKHRDGIVDGVGYFACIESMWSEDGNVD